ncbi:TIGR01777 family oxidoreductase [Kutzneria buriramensis]|uniref:TIGR01777 family protein n=1 Tax=Kutzneria buriramensis TaxID=1045776 RepID=A0A3E0GYA3_9PSEU|nr:TIGR01777 family oxidoreductase [Kutzneria buriramensis]REH34899.1 hypothetical protein BCF44_119175 [Kutzneria buriramensis]
MGIKHSSVVEFPLAEVFDWHRRPGAMPRLTPPWAPLRVIAESSSLRDGRAVLGLPGGLRWLAAHQPDGYDPPHRFVDELASQPLRTVLSWRHTHEFAAAGDSATRVTDRIDTPVPGAALRSMVAYRHRQLAGDLTAHRWARELRGDPMTIAITGSGGMIGSQLAALLSTGGHTVIRLVRRAPRTADERHWRPDDPDAELLAGVDAVVHLAGTSIAGRFTPAHKAAVRDSRIEPTRRLAELAVRGRHRPASFVSASAVGIYGADRGDELLTEKSPRGEGFLADLVADWEDAARVAADGGIRVVTVRTGIVQSPRGGTLRLLFPLFAAGLGGRLGDGRQWLPWIGIDDVLDVYLRALVDSGLSGAVNAVAPQPVRNVDYTRALAAVLHRPALLPVPSVGPRLLLGEEGAVELASASQRVVPHRLELAGHRFRHPSVHEALAHVLGHELTAKDRH